MNALPGWAYLGVFLATVILTLVLVPLMLRMAIRLEVLDRPQASHAYKQQGSPIPYLGGIAIVVAFSSAVLVAALLSTPASALVELLVMLGCAVGLSLMGLVDDLRGLPTWLRLAVILGLAGALYAVGVRVELFGGTADFFITIVWIAGITNAFNLLDNMDGLSAGVAAIAATSFFLIAVLNDQFLVAALSIALAGCALAFLRSNFHPARIYMGDAGSLFLGFMLAVLGIKLRFDAPVQITALVPLLVLGVAVFDTSLVTVTRVANHLSPMLGGRDHVSHRLVFVGLPVRAAVGLIYGAGVALGWIALIVSRLEDALTAMLVLGLVGATGLFLGVMLAMVPVHSRSRRRHLMFSEVVRHEDPAADSGAQRRDADQVSTPQSP